jgi:peptidoglycan-associated lipoprotein
MGKSLAVRGVLLLAVLVLFASGGCAKKQTVKTQEGGGAAGVAGSPSGAAGGDVTSTPGKDGGVTSSSVPTEKVVGGPGASSTTAPAAPASPIEVAKAEAIAGEQATKEVKSAFEDIHFDFDRYAIRDDAKPTLEKVAAYLRQNRAAKLLIEGHCDERGTSEYNMALGERRAESTRKYLAALGVPESSLSTVSFGKEKPLDPAHDEGAWAKNRRAHFVQQ